jgi:hypothetical protein
MRDVNIHGLQTELHVGSHDEPEFVNSPRITYDEDRYDRTGTWSEASGCPPDLEMSIQMTRTFRSLHQGTDEESSEAVHSVQEVHI